ncbi:PREDICTED: uncharacterized protein LOC108360419 isoform X2 [Rhagoletis zephyria]|uniref:uncharacterized protein LOC108360419 isoform X2 n=1 Tax=Rhagoletis zephyria TaxID=28612 RepID=UPI00081137B0|nr:PREDICTED: uncharacterized protein LOC108360419 isoform X2 [Rhagoletis zephyria]
MNADESSDAGAKTKLSGEKNVLTMNSEPATTSKKSTAASASNAIHSNQDFGSIKHIQLPNIPQITAVAPSAHPVVTDERLNANSAKRVIRKVMVIDPKKLQQAGLDRKLAEAIGRQKLKALAQEKKNSEQNAEPIKLLTHKPQKDSKSLLVRPSAAATVKTYTKSIKSTLLTTPATHTVPATIEPLPTIKKSESVKNESLKSPATEITTTMTNATFSGTAQNQVVTKSPAAERKDFVTPKITITRPGEEITPLRIVPEHRLENVKYILQCRILKKQQLAAQATKAVQQTIATTPSTACLSNNKLPLLEPKVEIDEFPSTSTAVLLKKPSPAKTPQDIARVLDFSSEATTVSSASVTATAAIENKVEKTETTSPLHIKNYGVYVPKASPIKAAESEGRRAVDIARLVARNSTATMRNDLEQPVYETVKPIDIPKASIRCKNLLIEPKATQGSSAQCSKKNVIDTQRLQKAMPKLSTGPASISKNAVPRKLVKFVYTNPRNQQTNNPNDACSTVNPNAQKQTSFVQLKDLTGFAHLKQPFPQDLSLPPNTKIKLIYKKQPVADELNKSFSSEPKENNKTANVETNTQPNNEPSQFKDFPAYSPLKTPFPVVTHSQDLPLPTISTFRTPFPTTLIKVGKMGQPQSGGIMSLTAQHATTPGEEDSRPSQSAKSLIVLENKVLAPDEKIDLTALGLETPKMEPTSGLHALDSQEKPAPSHNVQENIKVSQPPIASTSAVSMKNLLAEGAKLNNRKILSIDKLQFSAEKVAELVKIIKAQNLNSKNVLLVRNLENKPETSMKSKGLTVIKLQTNSVAENRTQPVTTMPNEKLSLPYRLTSIQSQNIRDASVAKSTTVPLPIEKPGVNTSRTQIENNYVNKIPTADSVLPVLKSEPLTDPESQSDSETQFKNPLPLVSHKSYATDQFGRIKSSGSVIDSGDESDASISAVDFIASLAAEHPITEDTQLELSPEELNLNASFAMNFSPLRIPNRDRTVSIKSEIMEQDAYEFNEPNADVSAETFDPETMPDDVQIGKIITISEENILKAVAASQTSGNAETQEVFKLTKSTEYLDANKEEVNLAENLDNLDVVDTDNLAESKVGPILVKNIEVGVINNFENQQTRPLIVKNFETDRSSCFGQLSTNEGIVVESTALETVKVLPVVSEASAQSIIIANKSNSTDQQESTQISNTENAAPKMDQADHLKASAPFNADENTDSNENLLEISSAAPKRLPRLKKGKINLVQRKKTTALSQETKAVSKKASEIVANSEDQVEVEHNQDGQVTVLEEGNKGIDKVMENDLKATKVKLKVDDVKQKWFSESSPSKVEGNSAVLIEPMGDIEDNDNNLSDYADEQWTCEASPLNECVSPTPPSNEWLPKSSDLKRKTADISELLNPPKMPKRRSAGADDKPAASSIVSTPSGKKNLLLTAVKATTKDTELTPAKNPFKKAKVEVDISEKPMKGIQNLLTKFSKDKNVVEQREGTDQIISESKSKIREANVSVKAADAGKSPQKQSDVMSAAKNQLKPLVKNKEELKHNEKPDSGQELQEDVVQKSEEIAENKTDNLSCSLKQETQSDSKPVADSKQKRETTNLNVSFDSEKNETIKVSVASNDCDSTNVIANEQLEVKISEDNEDGAEQPKSGFLGFDHTSPSTHNIESNLQHILTITNSAEQTKTRDENFSTAERESPHAIKSGTKFRQARKSTNRRSVPLKKRWGVMSESDDDIDITDDTTPADDEEDTDETTTPAGFRSQIKSKGPKSSQSGNGLQSDTDECEIDVFTFLKPKGKQVVVNELKEENSGGKIVKIAESENTIEQAAGLTTNKKRTRVVTISESTSSSDLETPHKRIRIDAESNTSVTSRAAESDKKDNKCSTPTKDAKLADSPKKPDAIILEKSDAAEPTNTSSEMNTRSHSLELEVPPTVKTCRPGSRTSVDDAENTQDSTKKPKAKRVRKPKVTIELNDSAEIQLKTPDAHVDQNENEGGNISTINETENDSHQTVSAKEIGNDNSKARENRTKKIEAKETKIDTDQPKAVKKRGRKPKVVIIDAPQSGTTSPSTEIKSNEMKKATGRHSKGYELSTSIVAVTVKEEFVSADAELVVPSLTELEAFQEGLKNSEDSTLRESVKIASEFATSTATAVAESAADNIKQAGKKSKSLGEIVVSLAKNQAENEDTKRDESTPIVRKKRGRKPKSLNATLPSTTESTACNSIAELKNTSVLNDTQSELSINSTAAVDSSANLSQSAADFETPIKVPKKRGRKPKVITATAEALTGEEAAKPVPRKARGVVDLETRGTFNERLLLITKREQLESDEVLTAEPVASTSKTTNIACGLCLQQMDRDAWLDHLATHYGVGWIVGETTPTNVTIRNEVLKAMTAFLKTNGGKYTLTCRMCHRTFRSALGALLHIELCGATDSRVPCDYCKRQYSKLSLLVHMRECRVRFMNTTEEGGTGGADATDVKEAVFNNVGRKKRASVQKAEKILKAIGIDARGAGISTVKDAKNYIQLVPAQPDQIERKWSGDLESTGKAHCPTPDCTFETQELTALQTHYKCCELKEVSNVQGFYICRLCASFAKTYNSAKDAIKHVLQEHRNAEDAPDFEGDVSDCGIKTDDESSGADDDISSGVDSNEESGSGTSNISFIEDQKARKNARRRRSRKKKSANTTNTIDRQITPRDLDYSNTAVKLWNEFTTEHYSTQPLYNDFKVNYSICARADYEQYFPRTECSMKFSLNSKFELTKIDAETQFGKAENVNWSQLQRFEMSSANDEHFIFIGEAIKIVSWVPLPADIHEQYLLISSRREYTRYKNPKIGNTLLWLYKITPANGLEPLRMQLHYAINIPDGPVHCTAFLPSGGYDASANRLGLVAVGTAASCTIKVYALPLDASVEKPMEIDVPSLTGQAEHLLPDLIIVQLQPVLQLILDVSEEPEMRAHRLVNTQCTALCWSEFSGHKHIFAGFANGCAGYWDISTDDNLNLLIINGLTNYLPMNFFYAREKNVHAMALHYDTSGVRLLALTVGRRILSIYDLHQFTRPILMKEEVARNEVMDLAWSPLWQSLAVAVSDSLGTSQCTYAVSPTNMNFKNETIDRACGAVTQIHYNPWQHIYAYATDNGDLALLNIREMHFKEILRDSLQNTRAAAIMDMKCLNGEDIPKFDPKSVSADWKFFEEGCVEKYGLVFGPMTKIDRKHKPQYVSAKRRPPVNLIRCTRINSMRCNLNVGGKKLIALGYENGLLRILNIDRKSVFD